MPPAPSRQNLLPAAALVSLLVLLLGAAGLFALGYSTKKSAAALERIRRLDAAEVATVEAQVSFKTQVQEWKNVLLRGQNAADYTNYLSRFEAREADVKTGLAAIQNLLNQADLDAAPVADLISQHAALGKTYRDALGHYRSGEPGSVFVVDQMLRGVDRKLNDEIDALARKVEEARTAELGLFQSSAESRYGKLRRIILGLDALAVIAAFWLVFSAFRASARE